MKKALIGKKLGMTQYISEDGTMVPVTVCELGPCVVVQKKTETTDGYEALKVGYGVQKEQRMNKAQLEELKRGNITPRRYFREIDVFNRELEVGNEIDCTIFNDNDVVQVTGTSKGHGFSGVIKRHGFGGGRMTHGSHFHRAPGSIGACAYPSEVWKGQKMPGRYGSKTVTVKNLKIVKVIPEKNLVLISGAVPGRRNSLITVREK
jgi:large subunit ribosomal protein L3